MQYQELIVYILNKFNKIKKMKAIYINMRFIIKNDFRNRAYLYVLKR